MVHVLVFTVIIICINVDYGKCIFYYYTDFYHTLDKLKNC